MVDVHTGPGLVEIMADLGSQESCSGLLSNAGNLCDLLVQVYIFIFYEYMDLF